MLFGPRNCQRRQQSLVDGIPALGEEREEAVMDVLNCGMFAVRLRLYRIVEWRIAEWHFRRATMHHSDYVDRNCDNLVQVE